MALGAFTLTFTFETYDGSPAAGKVRIDGIPQVFRDMAGDKFKVGPRTKVLDTNGEASISLPTDVAAGGGRSTAIAYRVSSDLTSHVNINPTEFYAYADGATVDLTELVPDVIEPVGDTTANRIAAQAAATAAAASAASVNRETANGVAGLDGSGKLYSSRIPDLSSSYAALTSGRISATARPYSLPAPSGSDDTTAVNAMLSAAVTAGAPVVAPANATYLVTALNVDNAKGVTIEGGSGAARLGTTTFKRTTTGTDSLLSARDTLGLSIKNIRFEYTNSGYTGRLVDLRGNTTDTGMASIENAYIGSTDATVHTALALDINQSYGITVAKTHFLYNDTAVNGLTGSGGYTNGIKFDSCLFSNSVQPHVRNAGNGWTFLNCIGQQRIGGVGGFYGSSDLTARHASNVSFVGGWYGDVTSGTNAQIEVNGNGFSLRGVYMGAGGGVAAKMMVATIYGFTIQDSSIFSSLGAVDYNSFTDGLAHTYLSVTWPVTQFINGTPPRGSIWESLTPNDGVHIGRGNIHGASNADWLSFFNSTAVQRFGIFDSGVLRWYNSSGTLDADTALTRTATGLLNTTGKFSATKGINGGTYATGSRPTASTAAAGTMVYDTTLGKPIWSTGSGWVDATGATV